MRTPAAIVILAMCVFTAPDRAVSEIVVYDAVVPVGREAVLRAETREGFFSKGGAVVEFFVEGRSLGKSLSGGDGVAYRRFLPARKGRYNVRIVSDGDQDEGMLLAVKRSAQLVFVDVEGSLFDRFIAVRPRVGALAAVRNIGKKYPIVFLQTSIVGLRVVKLWLKENGFPPAPVLPWNRGEALREMREAGVIIRALVGRADVVESAKGYTRRAFSFDAGGNGEALESWDEAAKRIK